MRQHCGHWSSLTNYDTLYRLTTECKSLRELVQTLQDANSKLAEEDQSAAAPAVSKVRRLRSSQPASQVCSPQVGPTGELERSLEEAEEKISGLLQVKEKLVNVQVISRAFLFSPNYEIFSGGGEGEAGGRRDEA